MALHFAQTMQGSPVYVAAWHVAHTMQRAVGWSLDTCHSQHRLSLGLPFRAACGDSNADHDVPCVRDIQRRSAWQRKPCIGHLLDDRPCSSVLGGTLEHVCDMSAITMGHVWGYIWKGFPYTGSLPIYPCLLFTHGSPPFFVCKHGSSPFDIVLWL